MAYDRIVGPFDPAGNKPGGTSRPLIAASTSLSLNGLVLAPGGTDSRPRRPRKTAKTGGDGNGQAPPATPDLTSLLTVPEAARQLRLSTRTLARAIALEQVKVVYFGRAVRIPRSEVERLAATGLPAPRRRK